MVTEELVKKVAAVARLELTEAELKEFTSQLSDVIKLFGELESVDTKGVEPSFHPLRTENVFRQDEVGECLSQEESLSNTSHKEDGFFKGPKSV